MEYPTDQAKSQAWSLWTKLAAPALLRCPVLGISALLVVSTPFVAAARTLPRSQQSASAEPTHRQLRVLRSYERYQARVRAQAVKARRAVRFAYRQVGKPYQWGGAGPRTYDCSGLVMAAWRKGGLRLPHRADLQHRMIRRKVGLKHLRPGDLVFFSGDHHVGIYVGRHHFLHAPHTGARVQRGTLSGWRLRVFAGAARPGAPAYHPWPHWVRTLAAHNTGHNTGHGGEHGGEHGKDRGRALRPDRALDADHAVTPDDTTDIVPPQPGDGDQASGTGADETWPPATAPAATVPAGQPIAPAGSVTAAPSAPAEAEKPVAPRPVMSPAPAVRPPAASSLAPAAAVKPVVSVPAPGGLSIPLLTMSAPTRGRGHAVAADVTPVPRPGAPADSRPRPRLPRTSVQHHNDEQRFDRDYDDSSARGDANGDGDADGDDGIDLRSLLGDAP